MYKYSWRASHKNRRVLDFDKRGEVMVAMMARAGAIYPQR
jgi:hypothetical protein